jgi:hypothetical protein
MDRISDQRKQKERTPFSSQEESSSLTFWRERSKWKKGLLRAWKEWGCWRPNPCPFVKGGSPKNYGEIVEIVQVGTIVVRQEEEGCKR